MFGLDWWMVGLGVFLKLEYNQILPERGIEWVSEQRSGHVCQVATHCYSSKNFSQLVSWDQLRVGWSKGVLCPKEIYNVLQVCHLWNERSEQSVWEFGDPAQESGYEHHWHWAAGTIVHYTISHVTLPPFLSPSLSCHLKAKATSPIMEETKPRRQRG